VLRRGLGGSGTTAVEPGWKGSSAFESAELADLVFLRVRGCGAPQTKGRRDAATHHGLSIRKSSPRQNPMSGSGPSVSARPEGEEPVEGAKNPEDGTCRVRQTRVMQIPPPMSLKGRETPGGAIRSMRGPVRALRPEP